MEITHKEYFIIERLLEDNIKEIDNFYKKVYRKISENNIRDIYEQNKNNLSFTNRLIKVIKHPEEVIKIVFISFYGLKYFNDKNVTEMTDKCLIKLKGFAPERSESLGKKDTLIDAPYTIIVKVASMILLYRKERLYDPSVKSAGHWDRHKGFQMKLWDRNPDIKSKDET